ncbi:hydrogenase maturation protease [bacterium]|nr:hydrogenase maturation protease [bacterium]MBU1984526.1 hydrogenase maturation protease [bacterium]
MSEILVIGYGNRYRRDDGVGPAAAERLSGHFPVLRVRCMAVRELTPELAEPISQARLVVFVDADAATPPGNVNRHSLLPSAEPALGLGHDFQPRSILALAKAIYGCAPMAMMFTLGGADFGHGEGFSDIVESKIVELTAAIHDYVDEALGSPRMLAVEHI